MASWRLDFKRHPVHKEGNVYGRRKDTCADELYEAYVKSRVQEGDRQIDRQTDRQTDRQSYSE
jgi:hypothetical protein